MYSGILAADLSVNESKPIQIYPPFFLPVMVLSALTGIFVYVIQHTSDENQSKPISTARPAETRIIGFARQDISKGTVLTANMLRMSRVDVKEIPGDGLWHPGIVLGRTTKYDLKKGEPICLHHFGLDKFDPEILKKWPPYQDLQKNQGLSGVAK